jgi:short/branched chain acyl-CoA dehydrogenase
MRHPADLNELRKTVRAFAEDVVAPRAAAMDSAQELDPDVLDGMAELGLFGLTVGQDHGGAGLGFAALCVAIEELARVDSSVAVTLEAGVSLGIMPIVRYGTEEQKRRWLPTLASGERLAAFALTEPESGSDTQALTTSARRDGDEWVIDGTKTLITNAAHPRAALATVAARTGTRPDGKPEVTTFIVPTGTPGYTFGRRFPKIGWRAANCSELRFSDCRVPDANRLGEVGQGLHGFLRILDEGRIAIAALATGVCQGCADTSASYAGERTAFSEPIGNRQGVAFKVADMALRAHLSRLAWEDAAARLDAGEPFGVRAAMAKLYASEAAVTCAREAVQVHGGWGFIDDSAAARYYRDAKILEIGEGTSEVMRILIARSLGLGSST